MVRGRSSAALWPYGLFFLSGLAGLVFEVVFLRQLTWMVGSSARATSLVLAAFMGGLALGAYAFGRIADRSMNPLRLYGWLEIGAALSGGALAWLLGAGRETLLAPLRMIEAGALPRIVEFVVAFVLVLVPTIFMGGTLPALSRFLVREMGTFVGTVGRLYGLNTLGAAIGVYLAGFHLVERYGVSGSAFLAAGLLAAVGVVAVLLPVSTTGVGRCSERSGGARPPRTAETETGDPRRWVFPLAAAASGFAVLGYEVAWTRLLSLFMRSFSYSFSLMLALFLVGLFLGATLLSLFGHRVARPADLLAWLQVAMGGYVAFSVLWLPAQLAPVEATSFNDFLLRAGWRAALIVLPPTLLSGMILPLAARGFSRGQGRVGSDVGWVYGINTGGAILGALAAGLLLLPWVGASSTLVVLATVNAASGTAVLFGIRTRSWHPIAALGLTAACALTAVQGPERFVEAFLRSSRSAKSIGRLLFFHEGATDTVAVVTKDYGFRDPHAKSLITNGVSMAASVKPVWRYMALEGHLPVLFARGRERALAVGVGTGITLGAVVSHRELTSITAVELSEGVVEGLRQFDRENDRAYLDPRVRLIREDGRHFLELDRSRYDLITLEPPPPIVAGAVHLYALDFYQLCMRRLETGGVVAQWLPLHAQSLASARMTARTFLDAFDHVQLWLPSVRDAVLIGSSEPLAMDVGRLLEAYHTPGTRVNLERAFLETPEALLATYLLDRSGVERWVGDALPITDERPRMEFFRHQGGNMNDRDIGTLLEHDQAGWDWLAGVERLPGGLEAVRLENEALRSYLRGGVFKDARLGDVAARLSRGTEFFLYPRGCASFQLAWLQSGRGGPSAPPLDAHLARCRTLENQ